MEIQFNTYSSLGGAVKKQLSRGRYTISDRICKLEIIINDEVSSITLDDNHYVPNVKNCSSLPSEPSVRLFDNFLNQFINNNGSNCSLIDALLEYQEANLHYGYQIEDKIFYKLYSKDEKLLNTGLRSQYGAKWIDYSAQLSNGEGIIFDKDNINGLWAMKSSELNNIVYCIDTYGDHLFTLELLPDSLYLQTKNEIIGHNFKVIRSMKLSKNHWFRKIQLQFITLRRKLDI
ncbi:hypothetical protein KQ224_10025 [Streptococcus parasuis]|uniref:hypothetical protein n=1 Tax=Streptococcus parasuis TaxID=1501662 RepID=UPI001C1FA935|nr:hypothetical protein [Streptococcus parasuis]QWV86339.1 hypothetical protein KQ224_10025 [Streptococcus parasuis]